MIKRFQNYIENEPWEESLRKVDKMLYGWMIAAAFLGGGYIIATALWRIWHP
ncbi:MAG: hypothetical protein JRD89_18345 [Deltaproteobacteria bacterium]|nr:hypothetical protein [Deltaproteobacteria bacterium]